MTATPADVQAKIDHAVDELKHTTQGYAKGGAGLHWTAALAALADARAEAGQLVTPGSPPHAAFTFKEVP